MQGSAVARRQRRALLAVRLFAAGLALSNGGWLLADALKRARAPHVAAPVLPWASRFHHPADAALLPYVAACVVALGYGLFLYLGLRPPAAPLLRRLRRTACGRSVPILATVLAAQAFLVLATLPPDVPAALAMLSVLACVAPLPSGRARGVVRALGRGISGALGSSAAMSALCGVGALVLLVALAVEPVKLATGPVHLLNEYRYLQERIRFDAKRPIGADLRTTAAGDGADGRLCRFVETNPVEYAFQNESRGPINHIGHVLNPINEYETGKPFVETYFQYGLGATFAFKWAMDLAGGTSLQAYHRAYLFYVAYWVLFAAAATILLRDARYVLASLGLLAIGYYAVGYEALVLAPGINPILHFLDLPILVAALRFYRSGRTAPFLVCALGATAAVALNPFFGVFATLALAASAGLWVVENAAAGGRLRRLAALGALLAAPLLALALALPRRGGGGVTSQFLSGYFSWQPSPALVLLALAYVAASYLFLLWARDRRDPAKYAVVFLFVYAQGLLLYFFWSGLANHFWPVLPYVGLHVVLMLRLLAGSARLAHLERAAVAAGLVVIGLGLKTAVDEVFIRQRAVHRRVFASQELHAWPFARARVVATADPGPLAASLAQLERYSDPSTRGVGIISIFDNLLPFLARRHSVLPHFDLQWSLLTEADLEDAVQAIARARPRYLFVGREVEGELADPWEGLPCGAYMRPELESAHGRIREMRRVFDAVGQDYERVESGPLLTVYRRRDRPS